jgi:hypothetical protein
MATLDEVLKNIKGRKQSQVKTGMGSLDEVRENIKKRSKATAFRGGKHGQFGNVEDRMLEREPIKLFPTMDDVLKGKQGKWPGNK